MTASTRVFLRRAAVFALSAGVGLGAGLLAAVVVPALVGYHTMAVMSGSMEPVLDTGDIIVAQPIAPLSARVGDVVTFHDPTRGGRLVTHRVRRVQVTGQAVQIETKGDANNTAERWTVPARGRIGRVVYRIPRFGYLVRSVGAPGPRVAIVSIAAVIIGGSALRRIWRPDVEAEIGSVGVADSSRESGAGDAARREA